MLLKEGSRLVSYGEKAAWCSFPNIESDVPLTVIDLTCHLREAEKDRKKKTAHLHKSWKLSFFKTT